MYPQIGHCSSLTPMPSRLASRSRELSQTVSYKLLYQRRQDIWHALKELGDPLIDAELTHSDGRHFRDEPIYREAIARARRLRSVQVERDYYYESMLMDLQARPTPLSLSGHSCAQVLRHALTLPRRACCRHSTPRSPSSTPSSRTSRRSPSFCFSYAGNLAPLRMLTFADIC
jgi:hypothetical protein